MKNLKSQAGLWPVSKCQWGAIGIQGWVRAMGPVFSAEILESSSFGIRLQARSRPVLTKPETNFNASHSLTVSRGPTPTLSNLLSEKVNRFSLLEVSTIQSVYTFFIYRIQHSIKITGVSLISALFGAFLDQDIWASRQTSESCCLQVSETQHCPQYLFFLFCLQQINK